MRRTRAALGDAVAVVVDGVRLTLRHGPVLLAIFLAGAAVRNGVLWGAVVVSEDHSTIAGFMLPFAPLGSLVALILMLRVAGSSLTFTAPDAPSGRRLDRSLALLASTLIPFLAVYAAQGYLREDTQVYLNEATYDEIYGQAGAFYGQAANIDRTAIAQGQVLVAIVVIALVLRFLLGRFDLASRHVSLGLLAAYVEVLWLLVIAVQISNVEDSVWSWVGDRSAVVWVQDRWAGIVEALGPFGDPLAAVAGTVGTFLASADDVVVVPVAWLTVGAVALGQSLDLSDGARPDRPARPWQRHVDRVPAPVRGAGSHVVADLRGRFGGLFAGLRLLVVGGLVPMLLFCVVFLLSRQAGWVVGELWRLVVGPVSRDVGLTTAPYVGVLTSAAETVLLAGLLAAAVDRIVRRRDLDSAGAAATGSGVGSPSADRQLGIGG